MILQGRITDRNTLIKSLESVLHEKAIYHGAPGFIYTVGEFTVLRDGSIQCPDVSDEDVVHNMMEAGIIENQSKVPTGLKYSVTDARMQVNVINTLSSKAELINKAIGKPRAFNISVQLQRSIRENNPSTVGEVLKCIYESGGEKTIKGICIAADHITFTGFPEGSEDADVYRHLADKIVESSQRKRWIKPAPTEGENEKYIFRVWMNSIGMKGSEYARTREILLRRLDGDGAFRLQEQKDAFLEKRRKPINADEDFVLL